MSKRQKKKKHHLIGWLFKTFVSLANLMRFLVNVEIRAWKKGRVPKRFLIISRLLVILIAIIAWHNTQEVRYNGDCTLPHSIHDPSVQQYWPEVYDWCPIIMQESFRQGLDPELTAAVIWVESRGNPSAYSRSGAVGLMQVMPKDGIAARFMCPNGPCFHDRPTISQLQDPEFNIAYGTQLLAENIKRTGSIRAGLRAYGPKDVGYTYADLVLEIEAKINESS